MQYTVVAIACCLLMIGCENSLLDRSLVFSTATTMGVEVSVSPTETSSPVKLIIGYKRYEGVLNPVYYNLRAGSESGSETTGTTTTCTELARGDSVEDFYLYEAYSVLAKFRGEASAAAKDAEGKMSVAQWFATGEAAKTLAKQPGIAGAVSGSSEIAKAAAEEAQAFARLRGEPRETVYAILSLAYGTFLDLRNNDPDPTIRADAGAIVDILDNVRVLADIQGVDFANFTRYRYAPPNLTFAAPSSSSTGFDRAIVYRATLYHSVQHLKSALADPNLVITDAAGTDVTASKLSTLPDELIEQSNMLEKFDESLFQDPGVVKAVNFLMGD